MGRAAGTVPAVEEYRLLGDKIALHAMYQASHQLVNVSPRTCWAARSKRCMLSPSQCYFPELKSFKQEDLSKFSGKINSIINASKHYYVDRFNFANPVHMHLSLPGLSKHQTQLINDLTCCGRNPTAWSSDIHLIAMSIPWCLQVPQTCRY